MCVHVVTLQPLIFSLRVVLCILNCLYRLIVVEYMVLCYFKDLCCFGCSGLESKCFYLCLVPFCWLLFLLCLMLGMITYSFALAQFLGPKLCEWRTGQFDETISK